MKDHILIRQLKVDAVIGIHDWEKQKTQPLYLDFDLQTDCRSAAQSDHIDDALDYFEVCQQVKAVAEASRCELIETLAEQLCQHVLTHFPCDQVRLTLYKPEAVADADTVGISITRTR